MTQFTWLEDVQCTTLSYQVRYETIPEAREADDRIFAAWAEHPAHYYVDNTTDFDGLLIPKFTFFTNDFNRFEFM